MIIDLTPEAVENPTRLGLAAVVAWMLWPDDADMRRRWERAARIEEWSPILGVLPEPVLRHFAKELHTALFDKPSLMEELQPLTEKRELYGRIAGQVVGAAVLWAIHDPKNPSARLVRIRTDLAERLNRDQRLRGKFGIAPQTLANVRGPVQRFAPVAHLWAAHDLLTPPSGRPFPCAVNELGEFLATAEAIREAAETTRMSHRQYTVMRPGKAVRLPADVLDVLRALYPEAPTAT